MRLLLIGFLALLMSAAPAQTRSPEVHPDGRVSFRLRSPNAQRVTLALEGHDAKEMVKAADGWWTITTDPLPPDLYGYSFSVDGVTALDPQNPLTKPNLIWQSNMVLVPGGQLWEVQDVPRGTLHRHFYKSAKIGDHRDYYVYTPPGYDPRGRTRYPVLYLLHGFSDTANGWTSVGMAHVILDSLIFQGKAKPMIVVMPLGYGVPDFASPGSQNFRNPELVARNYGNFTDALLTEVLPAIEKGYRAASTPRERAIAGLSMGGAESLIVGLNHTDRFSYIGAFSSGGLGALDSSFPKLSAEEANKRLRQLWISCGTEDGLIGLNRTLDKWLSEKGVRHTYKEMPGRHTWMVWRRNLAEFAQLLFR